MPLVILSKLRAEPCDNRPGHPVHMPSLATPLNLRNQRFFRLLDLRGRLHKEIFVLARIVERVEQR